MSSSFPDDQDIRGRSPAATQPRPRSKPCPASRLSPPDGAWALHATLHGTVVPRIPTWKRTCHAKTVVVVVPVVAPVPVAIGRAQVVRPVVPRPAAQNGYGTVRPRRRRARSASTDGLNQPLPKSARRRLSVFACSACAIHAITLCRTSCSSILPSRHRSRKARNRFANRRTFSRGKRRRPPSPSLSTAPPVAAAGGNGVSFPIIDREASVPRENRFGRRRTGSRA